MTIRKIALVYVGAFTLALFASCTRAHTADPNKVEPLNGPTAGEQQLRTGSAAGVANSAPTTEDNNGFATMPVDGATTSVAPATATDLTGTSSGTTTEPQSILPREGAPAGNGFKRPPNSPVQ